MDKIGKRLLLSAGIGLGVAVSGVSLYLLFKSDDDYFDSNQKKRSITTSHQTVTRIRVPEEYIGAVIGHKGVQIKRIQTETNTKIHSEDNTTNGMNNSNNLSDGSKYLVIKGLPENRASAELVINQIIEEQKSIITKRFSIPTQAVGRIIGKNGDNIRYLCDSSGAKIKVDRTHQKSSGIYSPLIITGTEEQIQKAQQLINEEIAKNERYLQNRSNTSGYKPQNHLTNACLLSLEDGLSDSEIDFDKYVAKLELNNDNQLIDVFVSAVKSPNHFYLQLAGHKGIQLDQLMEEMTDYYEVEENRANNKPNEVKVGDIVSVPYEFDEHWYRARVISVEDKPYSVDESKVGIFYLDYGDEALIKRKQICCLKDDLLRRLPFQAIECSLSGVGPKYQIDWSEDAINSFKELTHMALWKTIYAKVIEIRPNGKHEKTFVELIDIISITNTANSNTSDDDWNSTQTSKTLNIGEEMIRKGFGVRIESDSSDSLPQN
jgi:tudor domain-containing protein 2